MSEKDFNFNVGTISGEQVNVGQNVTATQNNYNNADNKFRGTEVLHIVGEEQFGLIDQTSLKSAGVKTVSVDTFHDPYYTTLIDELERQRSDNKVNKLWHFSGHGDAAKGLLFGKEWVAWDLFNELITPYDELEVLFIAACSSVNVADAVSGKINWVLACAIDVPDVDAAKATEIFWKNIIRGKSPEESFEATKLNIPNFAPNLRLRGV